MDLDLAHKHVLVTGASKGIGRAIAQAFAAEGARVTLVARHEADLKTAAQAIGPQADFLCADLANPEGRARLIDARPDIDILVNNAGSIKSGPAEGTTLEDWRTGFDLKVWGYIELCLAYAPRMQARRNGTIVNIIGMGGRATRSSYIIGAAGNAALIGFTQALGAATPADQVRVFGINPATTKTDRMITRFRDLAERDLGDAERWEDRLAQEDFPFGRPKTPEEVAALSVMLASPKVAYLSGTVVDMDGGAQWRG